MTDEKQHVGQTRDAGFQIGVRRILPIEHKAAWRLLTSREGVRMWLGEIEGELAKGVAYRLSDDTIGHVSVFVRLSHLRITRQPQASARASTIQLRVIPNGDCTTVAFHEEQLPRPDERAQRRIYYRAVLDQLEH